MIVSTTLPAQARNRQRSLARRCVLGALLLFLPSVTVAQVGFGARAGLNVATATGDPELEREAVIGFVVGVYGHHRLYSSVSVRGEVLLSQRGARLVRKVSQHSYGASYVDLPLLITYTAPLVTPIALDLYAGPVAGLRLSGPESPPGWTGIASAVDLGVVVGADVSAGLRSRRERFGVGIRKTTGLSRALPGPNEGLRHRVFAVTAHVQF